MLDFWGPQVYLITGIYRADFTAFFAKMASLTRLHYTTRPFRPVAGEGSLILLEIFMSQSFEIIAELREEQGKGASRRLRRTGRIPAVVYGAGKEAQSISVSHNELWKQLRHESFYSRILTMTLAGKSEQVVLKDLHRHPVREEVMHMDLLRVKADVEIRMRVPLHFQGEKVAPGVKTGGGIFEHLMNEVEVSCLPKDLPEFIEVDVSGMNVDESIHLSQIKVPEGVVLTDLSDEHDQAVIAIHLPRVAKLDAEEDSEAEAGEDAEGKAEGGEEDKG